MIRPCERDFAGPFLFGAKSSLFVYKAQMKFTTFFAVCFVSLALSLACFAGASSKSSKGRSAQAISEQAEPFFGWQKLDINARQTWEDYRQLKMELMIKCTKPVGKAEKKIISEAGFIPTVCAGDICTGKIAINDLPKLATVDFLQAVEGAKALHYKK